MDLVEGMKGKLSEIRYEIMINYSQTWTTLLPAHTILMRQSIMHSSEILIYCLGMERNKVFHDFIT